MGLLSDQTAESNMIMILKILTQLFFMRLLFFPWALLILFLGCTHSNSDQNVLILQGVHVITMESEEILENQDLKIVDGVIESIGSNISVPRNSVVVNAEGLFLMPALYDMHAHVSPQNPWHVYQMSLYTYFGIHHVNLMTGSEGHREMAEQFNNGEIKSVPKINLASELIDGDPPMWGEQHNGPVLTHISQVDSTLIVLKEKGYRDLKVYNRIPKDIYTAILERADELDMRVIGHVPFALDAESQLDSRHQRIDHLEGYLKLAYGGDNSDLKGPGAHRTPELIEGYDPEKMLEAATLTAEREIWNTPTHVLYSSLLDSLYIEEVIHGEYSDLLDPGLSNFWTAIVSDKNQMPFLRSPEFQEIHRDMVRILHEAGARILAGTDSPLPVLLYGHSLHKELQYFVDAGMSPYEALQTATVNPAEYLEMNNSGKVAQGYMANLILLRYNPLENIKHTLEIDAVIAGNKYLNRSDIRTKLKQVWESLNEEASEEDR